MRGHESIAELAGVDPPAIHLSSGFFEILSSSGGLIFSDPADGRLLHVPGEDLPRGHAVTAFYPETSDIALLFASGPGCFAIGTPDDALGHPLLSFRVERLLDGAVALRHPRRTAYLSASPFTPGPIELLANRSAVGDWERFTLRPLRRDGPLPRGMASLRDVLDGPLAQAGVRRLLAAHPSDLARHADAFVRLLDPAAFAELGAEVVEKFESLGDNCELGMMQRAISRERLGLFRYAGSADLDSVVTAIENGFDGFGTEDDLELSPFHDEWLATSRRYGFSFHTGVKRDARSADATRKGESMKLLFLARKLLEEMSSAHKVFVRRCERKCEEAGMHRLHAALRVHGPSRLLWVEPSTATAPHASISRVADGLYLARHGALTPFGRAIDFRSDLWVSLLLAADASISVGSPSSA